MDAPRFAVDHMLLKLGKYLRVLGLDADWDTSLRTHELILRANDEERVFLTRNTRLDDQYPHPLRLLRIESCDPVGQLRIVVRTFAIDPLERLFTRCIRCNVGLDALEGLSPAEAARVPLAVRGRHERFWRCPRCATIFWHGTHVANTRAKLGI